MDGDDDDDDDNDDDCDDDDCDGDYDPVLMWVITWALSMYQY